MAESPRSSEVRGKRAKRPAQEIISKVRIAPAICSHTVTIHVADGTVWATPNGGALRITPRDEVRWEGEQEFQVSFVQLGGDKQPWGPFTAKRDASGRFAVTARAKAGAMPPFYEYSITVGDLRLDPIVIVDKLR
jgi:hypothetical protein